MITINDTPESGASPVELIRERLEAADCRPRPQGNGYMALCPAHDDHKPSLSINVGEDGRVLLYCHAGCAAEDIVAKLGLEMRDLFPAQAIEDEDWDDERDDGEGERQHDQGNRRIVATYRYRDGEGTVLYEVVRSEPKQFRQRRPDGRGGWAWNLNGVERVLYRLPELARADAGATVFLVEGEKDADTLARRGLVATTASGGAGKWRDEYNESLRGRNVVILPDNDDPGRAHAEQVAGALQGITASVRVLALPDLPPKGDVSDWLAAGHTSTELMSLIGVTPLWTATTPAIAVPVHAQPPAPPDEAAFYGLAGEIVAALDPSTEADPVAIVFNVLAAVGSIIGNGPHWAVSGTKHALRVYPVLVGDTGKGRKGTSWGSVSQLFTLAAPEWAAQNVANGLSSGEGVIHHVRDPLEKQEPVREGNKRTGAVIGYETIVVDAGVADKRLFVIESEFAGTLKVMGREGNTLSAVIRQAWDGGDLRTLVKNSPERATNAHVTILGHITKEELLRYLNDTEAANGFANRFLWVYVRRSKLLPDGGMPDPEVLAKLTERLRDAFAVARGIGLIERDEDATQIWRNIYGELSTSTPGLVGNILGRAEAQVMRLAALYAVLDGSRLIRPQHLDAALALWDYLDASAKYIFGEALGDHVADTILAALRASETGLTQTQISDLFSRKVSASRIDAALHTSLTAGKVRQETRETRGRPTKLWWAT